MKADFDPAAVVSFLRGIVGELREKRLWPVAVVLLAAIVAVPMLLAKSSSGTPVAQVPQTAPPPSASTSLPALSVQSTPAQSRLTGRARDPFPQPGSAHTSTTAVATAASTATTAASAANAAAAAATSTPSSASTGGTSSSTSTTPTTTPTTTISYYYDAVDLAFGKFGTRLKTYRNVDLLHIFPSSQTPVVVYMGLKPDAKTAVFLMSSYALVRGPGQCIPSAARCAFLDLKVGMEEIVIYGPGDGKLTPYELKVKRVHVVKVGSAAAAAGQANARVSHAGRKAVAAARRSAPDLPWPSYSPATGFLSDFVAHTANLTPVTPDLHTGGRTAGFAP
jgi:hypothetical protein